MSAAIEQQNHVFGDNTNGHADSELPLKLELELVIDDRDVIRALYEAGDGEERNQFAIEALKIGVVALRHVGGMVSADVIQRECGKLLRDMQLTFTEHKQVVHERIEGSLKEYFDPNSGRFNERVKRLVSNDGELSKLITGLVDGESSLLSRTLLAHVGRESPLMKQLDPEHSAGLLVTLKKNLEQELVRQREQVLKEFSLDNKEGALSRLVVELTSNHGDLSTALQGKIDTVVKELSLNEEGSALSRLVRNVSQAQVTITNEFSLDNDTSCLSRLKRELMTILEAHVKTNSEFQEEVKTSLNELVVRRQEQARSTRHGFDFQDAVCDFLTRECQRAGDIATETGSTTGRIKNCKVGDCVIELGPDSASPGATVVVEAKEEAGYTLARARQEIDTARKNRGADWGLFVFSKKTAPAQLEPFARYGNDFVVVWDSEDITSDVYLKAGVIASRALCFRAGRQAAAQKVDFEVIEKSILEIGQRAKNYDEIRKSAETIQSSSHKILERIRIDREALEKQVSLLTERVADLKELVNAAQ